MRSGTILTLSICGNLLLLGVLGYFYKSRPAPAQSVVVIRTTTNEAVGPPMVVSHAPAVATIVTNRFHWRKVESADYEQYIANLRAIGCPEKTLQDIILADVEKLFAERNRRANYQEVFWQNGSQRESARQAREQRDRALDKEKRDLIRKLLGIERTFQFHFDQRHFPALRGGHARAVQPVVIQQIRNRQAGAEFLELGRIQNRAKLLHHLRARFLHLLDIGGQQDAERPLGHFFPQRLVFFHHARDLLRSAFRCRAEKKREDRQLL